MPTDQTRLDWIHLQAVIYATLIVGLGGILCMGVELFGEPALRTTNEAKYLAFNLPYVIVPLVLLARMRKPLPFQRRF